MRTINNSMLFEQSVSAVYQQSVMIMMIIAN